MKKGKACDESIKLWRTVGNPCKRKMISFAEVLQHINIRP